MPSTIAPASETPKQGAIARFLITPLAFTSFLISLAIIDSHNASQRADPSGQCPSLFRRILYRNFPQPYAYVSSPDKDSGKSGSPGSKNRDEPWHWNTKHRKMMKMQISDAFEIRKWVLAGLLVGGFFLAMGVWTVGCWMFRLWW